MLETRQIATNGITLAVTEAGAGFPVLLCHGFPELAYSWRHQLPALAAAGYHAIAPDQRGYGGSSRPEAVEAYDLDSLVADLVGLLDALGEEKAVIVGHDWGGPVVWHMALTHPERVQAVAALSVPFARRPARPPLELMRAAAGPEYVHYVDYFQTPGRVEAEMAANTRDFLLSFLWSISGDAPPGERFKPISRGARFIDSLTVPSTLPPWLSEADLQVYVDAFERSGFTGGLNWYRNVGRNWEHSAQLAGAHIALPSLVIAGSRDPARNPAALERQREWLPGLRGLHILDGCGHWTQQERPEDVNRFLLDFLREVAPV